MLRSLSRFPLRRVYSTNGKPLIPPNELTEEEVAVFNKLTKELNPTSLSIQDLSGGCGQMYSIEVESEKFQGLSMIKQHRLVNQILKEDVSKWHGLRIKTKSC